MPVYLVRKAAAKLCIADACMAAVTDDHPLRQAPRAAGAQQIGYGIRDQFAAWQFTVLAAQIVVACARQRGMHRRDGTIAGGADLVVELSPAPLDAGDRALSGTDDRGEACIRRRQLLAGIARRNQQPGVGPCAARP